MIKFTAKISANSKKHLGENADWEGAIAEMKSRIEAISGSCEVSFSIVNTNGVGRKVKTSYSGFLNDETRERVSAIVDECLIKFKISAASK